MTRMKESNEGPKTMSEILNEQAKIYLSPENQVDIEDHLDNENVRYARVYFLGALDELLKRGGITSQVYREILEPFI
jgi:hypothetical protein